MSARFGALPRQNHQPPRVPCRKRIEQQVVESAERHGRGPNPQRQRKNGYEGKPPVLAQIPNRVPKIAEQVVEVRLPAGVADFFFDAGEATEFETSATSSFLGGDSRGHIVGYLALDMELELSIELRLRARFLREAANAAHHEDSYSRRKTRPTASGRRCPWITSAFMCLLPFLVRE